MKVLIAIPAMDSVPTQFAWSLATLQKEQNTIVAFQISSLVYTARNELARGAIKMGADFVLWLDSDMVFEPDTLKRLLKDYEEKKGDIITGVYYRRVPPFTPVLYDEFNVTDEAVTWKETRDVKDDFFEVEGCGFGCVLMPTEALFDVYEKYGQPFDHISGSGEDLSFCWRARQLGYKIVCDPSIQPGHVGHQIITKEFYEAYKSREGNT